MARRGKVSGPAAVLAGRPSLPKHLVGFWEAFQRLSSCRPIHMTGLGKIPWTAVDQYASRYMYVDDQYEELVHFVDFLDDLYLQLQSSAGTPSGKPRNRNLGS